MTEDRRPDKQQRQTSLETIQLALQSQAVLDIPHRIRHVITIGAIAGIGLVAIGSLVSGQEHRIVTDKIIHFTGYTLLSGLFVLSLRPLLFLPGLVALVGMGVVLELLQTLTGRSFELADALANTTGVAVGAGLALAVRAIHAYIRKDIAAAEVRRRLVSYPPGGVVYREGALAKRFFLVKRGLVEVSREVDGKPRPLSVCGPGDVVGAMSVILGVPQYASAVALTRVSLYAMDLEQLMESAGGREQPVATVLRTLAEKLREVAFKLEQAEGELDPELRS